MTTTPNALINESSPYLRQHAYNPVHWLPWRQDALELATQRDKLLIISIGYAACHWCHVMEKDSFEDQEVAAIMNQYFVSIKVDREERPDIDHIYMNVCQLINNSGGWPLNIIALPDGRPVYAGTFFPKENWKNLLAYFHNAYQNEKDKLIIQAEKLTEGIKYIETFYQQVELQIPTIESIINAHLKSKKLWDFRLGGLAGEPKFVMPGYFMFLINYIQLKTDSETESFLLRTLDQVATQGIFDWVEGGWARYSTDENWLVPHFEKMLYDNALLIQLYAQAYLIYKDNDLYKFVITQSINYCMEVLSDGKGVYYASMDADSEGIEGKYYIWSYNELKEILSDNFEEFITYFDVRQEGNWEGAIILRIQPNIELSGASKEMVKSCLIKLKNYRKQRIAPSIDDKAITAWNAMMVSALCKASLAMPDNNYIEQAYKTADHLMNRMTTPDLKIYRNFHSLNNKPTINGFLDDYAFVIKAYTDLYHVSFDEKWLLLAAEILSSAIERFYNQESFMFYYKDKNDDALIAHHIESQDNVIPSSNAVMAANLYHLSLVYGDENWRSMAFKMVSIMGDSIHKNALWYYQWTNLAWEMAITSYEVVIIGKDAKKLYEQIDSKYRPNILFFIAERASALPIFDQRYVPEHTYIYVCSGQQCSMPVKTIAELETLIAPAIEDY